MSRLSQPKFHLGSSNGWRVNLNHMAKGRTPFPVSYTRNGEKWVRFLFWELGISIKFDENQVKLVLYLS